MGAVPTNDIPRIESEQILSSPLAGLSHETDAIPEASVGLAIHAITGIQGSHRLVRKTGRPRPSADSQADG